MNDFLLVMLLVIVIPALLARLIVPPALPVVARRVRSWRNG
ncbi:MAG: hypothetical protein AAF288_06435 [Planctomycetota bacterium]